MVVNGRFAPDMCTNSEHPTVRVMPIAEAMKRENFERHFSRYADYAEHSMTALNTALMQDGAYVEIAPGTHVQGFIHLLFIGGGHDEPIMAYPRNLIVVTDTVYTETERPQNMLGVFHDAQLLVGDLAHVRNP